MNDEVNPQSPIEHLSIDHYNELHVGSGISDEVIRERYYLSAGIFMLHELGFNDKQCNPGLLMPVYSTNGGIPLHVLKPNRPRQTKDGKFLKYEIPADSGIRIDCPPRCQERLADPSVPLWITEGIKKADALASHGLCAIDLLGVWNFKGQNSFGGVTFLADWDYIALENRPVRIVFDSDVMVKPQVRLALDRITEHLQRKGAIVSHVYLPAPAEVKVGVDDYLLDHTIAELESLVVGPKIQEKAAPVIVELLDDAPLTQSKPLQLIDGHGYAAVWLWTKSIRSEKQNEKTGEVIRLSSPEITKQRKYFVVRDDGTIFGEGSDQPLKEIGFEFAIKEPPRLSRLWTKQGVTSYRSGARVPAKDVFQRLVTLIDHFIAFDRSLEDQNTMCEMIACYALSTWFIDAFSVIGFLWPNGGYGCGKTKLATLIGEVSYLGEVLLSGSSFATLRDLADFGGTLVFDDAEGTADGKNANQDKRDLMLAGNKKGVSVALKEVGPDGAWHTRFVNAYCTRIFTATRLPEPILASRTIVVPLVRTADAKKANADVLDFDKWPVDHQMLLNDLWNVALSNIASMSAHEAAVNEDAPLVGRNLEPWKATLSVAHWLDEHGEDGLYERLVQLAQRYQEERQELETPDTTKLVVEALVNQIAPPAPPAPCAPGLKGDAPIKFEVDAVANEVRKLAVFYELTQDGNPLSVSNSKVGSILKQLRINAVPKSSGQKRKRFTTLSDVFSIAQAHGLGSLPNVKILEGILSIPGAPGANGAHGATDQDPDFGSQLEGNCVVQFPESDWEKQPVQFDMLSEDLESVSQQSQFVAS